MNTTVNTTINNATNGLVKGRVSGMGTRTRAIGGTRISAIASTGNLATIGMAFSSNVLFRAGGCTLGTDTGGSLTRFTRILGGGTSYRMTVRNCASTANGSNVGLPLDRGHTGTISACLGSYNISGDRVGDMRNLNSTGPIIGAATTYTRGHHMRICVCTDRTVIGTTGGNALGWGQVEFPVERGRSE